MKKTKFVPKPDGPQIIIRRYLERNYKLHEIEQGIGLPFHTYEVQENRKVVFRSYDYKAADDCFKRIINDRLTVLFYV